MLKQRERKCKVCRTKFQPRSMTHKTCDTDCAKIFAEKQRISEQRKESRVRREKLKTRSDYIKEAQVAFNAYIRARDAGQPCICCGMPLTHGAIGGGYDCGHYRSVGSAPHLRFDERNAHAQTKKCNRYGAGRAVDYRIGLIERIGIAEVESLEANQEQKKWTIAELIEIRDHYRAKLKEFKRRLGTSASSSGAITSALSASMAAGGSGSLVSA